MNTESVFILTGAGISAESGIATYRDKEGLWTKYDPEVVSTYKGFQSQPRVVQEFYNMGRKKMNEVEPNAAHFAIGQLMEEYEGDITLVTMNIDDLHERGGARDVLHMHGEINKSRCVISGQQHEQYTDIVHGVTMCECCVVEHCLRPDVVWFGEQPYFMNAIHDRIDECDIFVTIGTSGNVAPASEFVKIANYDGKRTYNINSEYMLDNHEIFTKQFIGPATETVPQFINDLLAGKL